MSTVEKLLIKGVRSYDPESHQVIEFLHPMTVIIGANGCGKTTKLDRLDELSARIHERKTKLAILQDRYKHLKQQHSESARLLSPHLPDSTEDLKQKLRQYESEVASKRQKFQETKAESDKAKEKLRRLEHQLSDLKTDLGAYSQASTEHKRKLQDRKQLVVDLCRELAIADVVEPEAFLEYLQGQLKDAEARMKETKASYDQKQSRVDEKHEQKRAKFNQLQARLQHLKQTEDKCRKTIRSLTQQLEQAPAQTTDVQSLEALVNTAELEHKHADDALKAFEAEIAEKNIEKQKKDTQQQLKRATERLRRIRQDEELQRKIQTTKDAMEQSKQRVDKILKKHGSELEDAAGDQLSPDRYHAAVVGALQSQERHLDNANRNRDAVVQHLADKNARQSAIKQSLETLQQEHSAWSQRLAKECPEKPLDDALKEAEAALRDMRSMQDLRPAMAKVYRVIKQKSQQTHACFVCQRDFASDQEAEDCLRLIEEKMQRFSLESSGDAESVTVQQQKVDKLKGLQMEAKRFQRQEERMSEHEGDLAALDNEIEELEAEKEKTESHIDDTKDAIQRLRALCDVAKDLKASQQRINTYTKEISSLTSRLTSGDTITLDEAEQELQKLQRKREELLQEESDVVRRRGKLQSACVQTQQGVSTRKDELAKVHQALAQQARLREQIQAQSQELTATQDQRKALRTDQQQYEKAMEDADRERRDLQHEREQVLEKSQREVNKISRCINRLDAIESDINRYVASGQRQRLAKCKEELEERQRDQRELSDRIKDLDRHMSQLSSDVSTHKQYRANIEANLRHREKEEEMQRVKAETDALRQEMTEQDEDEGDLGDRSELEEERDRLLQLKHTLTGRRSELLNKLQVDEEDLGKPHLKNVDAEFQRKSIECQATKQLQEDLNKYYSALDNAIVKFHALKMESINRIIKEIWQKTYQGNDIDYVEIVSDVEKKKETTRGKSYQYRVVMVKGDTRLDMRGRCSAGQKVMASIIIRLALADCFCANCGVLTLDEPTTNLDYENKEALAKCLADIVNDRKVKQPNFQLLLITHDEKFLELLHRFSLGRIYYRVSKDERGHSVIRQVSA
ncbi:hypothetical protein PTSG_04865 [Salpingoeca rosetta]|uniref:Rad50/SbcC-type AAA domain-containing protein n=1 Tax=Salpingoeca rosetta (strain ATCC 50818 / BSB-021) TaxID=946362 RepID=F2U8V0_SALR5|nr:uncharacterized protein PTSG_04865 [Salpingoeca rosetta]EGD73153.1 hypothetical protein PTSG_04865 [Salpingoeca rosetta]|eukprot:XP_004994184.1 hypothetical protein PTSG_04865 [Salpingoeca rosetta]